MALEERLRLIVDATTGTAESSFGRLTTSAERTATAADTAAESVAAAADRVAQARNREADAAGKLTIAEARLEEVRARYGEGSSQLVAAEERVASAQRNVQIAASNTAKALEAQEAAQRDATEAADRGAAASENAGRGVERFRQEADGLKGAIVGLVAGVSLADWVSESVTGFLEGARGASSLAMSMNATTEEGGRFLAVAQQLGLEMDDLLEIQASFADVVGRDADALSSFGAEVVKNDDGTTNWALTLQDALAHLQEIPDATQRNATGFRLFGEEGYKQLSRLLLSGRDVDEVFAAMGTPYNDEDVESARRFEGALADLSKTGGDLSRELGSTLVPILTGMLEAFGFLVDVAGAVPTPLGLAAVASVVLGIANRATAESGGLLAAALGAAQGAAARFSAAAVGAATSSGAAAVAMGGMRVAGSGIAGVLGGPLGLALLAVGAGFTLLNSLTGDNEDQSDAAARANEDLASALRESGGVITDNVRAQAAASAQTAGLLDQTREYGIAQGDITDAILGNEDAYDRISSSIRRYADEQMRLAEGAGAADSREAIGYRTAAANAERYLESLDELRGTTTETAESEEQLAGELEQTTDKAALATAAMDALTGAIESGNPSAAELSRLAGEAAAAQDEEARATDRAKAAIEAHNAVTRDAVAALLERNDAVYAAADADFAFLDAMDAANEATDDAATSADETAQAHNRLMQAAIAAGEAQGEAAVQAREAAGEVLTDVDRANVAAAAMIEDLRLKLNTPGLSDVARGAIESLIADLETAQSRGDIEAVLTLTGTEEAAGELDETTEDRETTVTVESRNGPAVVRYLDGIANAERLAIIRVESRNGPAVDAYLDALSVQRDRLAIIRVESRNGPAVESYLDGIASQYRLAIINVETRGGPAVQRYLDSLSADRSTRINVARGSGAPGAVGAPAVASVAGASRVMLGSVTLDLELTGTADRGQLTRAERGRARVEEIRAYERENGTGWRK